MKDEQPVSGIVPRDQWYWCGYPGHFIAAANCRYHLHTRIAGVIISTVGDYWPRQGEGRESIGLGRDFETYVFLALDSERPEGDMNRYIKAGERFWLAVAFFLCAATMYGVLQQLGVI